MPALFQALTAEPDPLERWLTFTYPVDFDVGSFTPKHGNEMKYHMRKYRNCIIERKRLTILCTELRTTKNLLAHELVNQPITRNVINRDECYIEKKNNSSAEYVA